MNLGKRIEKLEARYQERTIILRFADGTYGVSGSARKLTRFSWGFAGRI